MKTLPIIPDHPLVKEHVSASAIGTWKRCNRKEYFRKFGEKRHGIEVKKAASLELGTAVHEVLENWLRDGTPLDLNTKEGKIANPCLHLLPLPGEAEIEGYFEFVFDGVRFLGFIDATLGNTVIDHKTTGDPKWCKTPEDLMVDPQAMLYAFYKIWQHGFDEIHLFWNYIRTRGKKEAIPVKTTVQKAHVGEQFQALLIDAKGIVNMIKTAKTPDDVSCNADACGDFGGCPYKQFCNVDPLAALFSDFETSETTKNNDGDNMTMTALEMLKAKAAAKKSETAATAAIETDPKKRADVGLSPVLSPLLKEIEKARGLEEKEAPVPVQPELVIVEAVKPKAIKTTAKSVQSELHALSERLRVELEELKNHVAELLLRPSSVMQMEVDPVQNVRDNAEAVDLQHLAISDLEEFVRALAPVLAMQPDLAHKAELIEKHLHSVVDLIS